LSKKNNNTIIVTTIQKLSAAIRSAKGTDKFEKLKSEHIVFIVDECHRAVSDEEMKGIKELLPKSTWFGLTGTPIFDENKKQENGKHARTTADQYNYPKNSHGKAVCIKPLHAYTTKNAMEDESVLNFQVEYHCLLSEEGRGEFLYQTVKEKYPKLDPIKKLSSMTELEKEELYNTKLFEQDDYIKRMLEKIFKRQSVLERFKVVNGEPTMSAILTTHSIAQAKRIYNKLQEMKRSGTLLNGKERDERNLLRDPDFPRVAITYSIGESQEEMNEVQAEMNAIMQDYKALFGIEYADVDKMNININTRLARKDSQYKKSGQWLDMVIVVDRLLTGFDAPTIQTLYVDRELRYHKLLQAFSRTNRIAPNKEHGLVVTFRKPQMMRENVKDAIRLFTQQPNWETLVPQEYSTVKSALIEAHGELLTAKMELEIDPTNHKKMGAQVRAYQKLDRIQRAIKSYEDYEDDFDQLEPIAHILLEEKGHCENLKVKIREWLKSQKHPDAYDWLGEIEFSSSQAATHKDRIDSFYINQLLGEYQECTEKTAKDTLREKIMKEINAKPEAVQAIYNVILDDIDQSRLTKDWTAYFEAEIDRIIQNAADTLKVPVFNLQTSFNEYRPSNDTVPFINVISEASQLNKEEFEAIFNEKYRGRLIVIEKYWKAVIENELIPLREEIQT